MTISKRANPSRIRIGRYLTGLVWLAIALTVGASSNGQDTGLSTTPPTKVKVVSLQDALQLAKAYSPQFQAAHANATIAHENRLQARDARLPTVSALNQFLYTEGNGTPSGVFIANDGVHVYNEQAAVRENLLGLVRNGQSLQARAAEAVALAKEEIARRGLVATVVQSYYTLVASKRKIANAEDSLREANEFVGVTQKQEQAGDVSHVDVVKAQIEAEQRSRDLDNSRLAAEQAHVALAVLLFPHFDEAFSVVDLPPTLPDGLSFEQLTAKSLEGNPDIRSSQAGIAESRAAVKVARYGYLPSLALNFYYGIDANQFEATAHQVLGASKSTQVNNVVQSRQNLGYAADLTLDIPLWNWGATRSKVRAAESSAHLAEVQGGFAERQLQANIRSFYEQSEVARKQVASLTRSRDLASENLHLTMLRYQAGEATALEAVTAEDSLATARNAYEDGFIRYYTALAQLETLTGSL